jgi:hypothetical protein
MSNIAILTFLLGTVLGLRFRILVLLPVSLVGGLNAVLVTLLVGGSLFAAVTSALALVAAVQIGFLFGSLVRFSVAAARAGRSLTVGHPASRYP